MSVVLKFCCAITVDSATDVMMMMVIASTYDCGAGTCRLVSSCCCLRMMMMMVVIVVSTRGDRKLRTIIFFIVIIIIIKANTWCAIACVIIISISIISVYDFLESFKFRVEFRLVTLFRIKA